MPDILVSLLLLVVIGSSVRHLQARLSYMQRFIYIDDVESGEIGYSLSTLEAVLTYLAQDAGGLRKASKQNRPSLESRQSLYWWMKLELFSKNLQLLLMRSSRNLAKLLFLG